MAGSHQPMEELDVFKLFEEVADWVWSQVSVWPGLAQKTVGEQLIRAVDSVNANLVEGDGRYSTADSLRFFIIARGSAREARLWLRRSAKRGLVDISLAEEQIEKLTRATRMLNLLIRYRRERGSDRVQENRSYYGGASDIPREGDESLDPFASIPLSESF